MWLTKCNLKLESDYKDMKRKWLGQRNKRQKQSVLFGEEGKEKERIWQWRSDTSIRSCRSKISWKRKDEKPDRISRQRKPRRLGSVSSHHARKQSELSWQNMPGCGRKSAFNYTHDWKKGKEGEREKESKRKGRKWSEALSESASVSMAFVAFSRPRFREKNVCPKLTSWKVVERGFHIGHSSSKSMFVFCCHSVPLGHVDIFPRGLVWWGLGYNWYW